MADRTTEKNDQEPDGENRNEVESIRKDSNPLKKHKLLTLGIISAAAVVLLIVVIFLFQKKTVQASAPPLEVEVVEVSQENVPVYGQWVGTTDGMVNAEIRAQVSGYLLRQDYTEGSYVKKGQLMFEIDPRPFQAALDQAKGKLAEAEGKLSQSESQYTQAEAQVGQAKSQLEQAQAQVLQRQSLAVQAQAQASQAEANQRRTQLDVNKYRPLREQKAVTQQELDNAVENNNGALAQIKSAKAQIDVANSQIVDARAAVSTAQAQIREAQAQAKTAQAAITSAKAAVDTAQADVNAAQINLDLTRISSPIDGIAGIALAQVGNLLSPTSGALTTVSTVDPIKVYFAISEQEYLASTDRRNALQGLELELVLADGSNYPEHGRFFAADRQVDEKTGTIRMAGIFSNSRNVLRPGQYAQVRAVTSVKENALLVPQRSVSELQGIYQVAVVGDDNKVNVRNVKVGDKIDQNWVIENGLQPGEKVIVGGVQKVQPGATVVPKQYVPPAQTPK